MRPEEPNVGMKAKGAPSGGPPARPPYSRCPRSIHKARSHPRLGALHQDHTLAFLPIYANGSNAAQAGTFVRLPPLFTCQSGWMSLVMRPLDLLVDDRESRNNAWLSSCRERISRAIFVDSCHFYGLCCTRPRPSAPINYIIDTWWCVGICCSGPDTSAVTITPATTKI